MATADLIAQMLAKMDTLKVAISARKAVIAAQNTKLNMIMWMIGAAVAVIGVIVRLSG